jgi:hypothetical protein
MSCPPEGNFGSVIVNGVVCYLTSIAERWFVISKVYENGWHPLKQIITNVIDLNNIVVVDMSEERDSLLSRVGNFDQNCLKSFSRFERIFAFVYLRIIPRILPGFGM